MNVAGMLHTRDFITKLIILLDFHLYLYYIVSEVLYDPCIQVALGDTISKRCRFKDDSELIPFVSACPISGHIPDNI